MGLGFMGLQKILIRFATRMASGGALPGVKLRLHFAISNT